LPDPFRVDLRRVYLRDGGHVTFPAVTGAAPVGGDDSPEFDTATSTGSIQIGSLPGGDVQLQGGPAFDIPSPPPAIGPQDEGSTESPDDSNVTDPEPFVDPNEIPPPPAVVLGQVPS
jgi:hypothetical protein